MLLQSEWHSLKIKVYNGDIMSEDNVKHIEDPFIALLPERMSKFPRGPFDTCPKFTISEGVIEKGYAALANNISAEILAWSPRTCYRRLSGNKMGKIYLRIE